MPGCHYRLHRLPTVTFCTVSWQGCAGSAVDFRVSWWLRVLVVVQDEMRQQLAKAAQQAADAATAAEGMQERLKGQQPVQPP